MLLTWDGLHFKGMEIWQESCYGNNPVALYVTFAVLPWEGELLDPVTVNAIGQVREGYTGTFRFDPKEAIVVFGRTPPPARYFS